MYHIQVREPSVFGDLVTSLSPDTLLGIKPRLIGWKICKMKFGMSLHKEFDVFTPVPWRSIHVEPNLVIRQLPQHMAQRFQETLRVSSVRSHQSLFPQQRGYPTKQIKPFAVLTFGWDTKSLASFSPTSPQTRMKTEASLIFKNNRLVGLKNFQFFLTPLRTCGRPLRAPECRCSWLFSGYSPAYASTSRLAGLSPLPQNALSGELPALARPMLAGVGQIPEVSSANPVPIAASYPLSVRSDARDGASAPKPGDHPGSPHECSAPKSYGLTPILFT